MVEAGFLDTATAAAAVNEPLALGIESDGTSGPWRAPYFVSEVGLLLEAYIMTLLFTLRGEILEFLQLGRVHCCVVLRSTIVKLSWPFDPTSSEILLKFIPSELKSKMAHPKKVVMAGAL
jgi:hypothetical protein